MSRNLVSMLSLLAALTLPAGAHIGSPNVFFEGKAGAHTVRVSIRPPAALPGLALVSVRLEGAAGARVKVRPVFWLAGEAGAPEPTAAAHVPGAADLYEASVWLLRSGSYKVEVTVEGSAGRGTAVVPLVATATRLPVMTTLGRWLLGAMTLLLAAGLVLLARAAAPNVSRRRATVFASILVVAALGAMGWRWWVIDRDFRAGSMQQALPLQADIRTAGALRLLHLTPGKDGPLWAKLAPDHGKLMHLFLVSEPSGETFAHLHPVQRDERTFENVLPPLPAGYYALYAEVTQPSGASQTLSGRAAVPAPTGPELPPQASAETVNEVWCRPAAVMIPGAAQPSQLDADDTWHSAKLRAPTAQTQTQVAALPDGRQMLFENAGNLVADRETALRFTVLEASGRRATLQPYIGMLGHAVLRRADGSVFTHLHPAGTISMAAQEIFARPGESPLASTTPTHEVTFPYGFPQPGEYRLWVQVRVGGKIVTGRFDVHVHPAP